MYQCLGFWVIRAGQPTQNAKIALAHTVVHQSISATLDRHIA
jgi:hypothetical protein